MARSFQRVAFLAIGALLLAGCWDYIDIERRSLVMGIGIDARGELQMELTVEIPVPAAADPGEAGGEGGGGDMDPKLVASEIADSLLWAANNLRGQLERDPMWEQVVAVVVGEEAARRGIASVSDAVMRFVDLNMRAHLYVVEGEAKDVIGFQPPMQPLVAKMLRGQSDQFPVHPRFARPQAFVLIHRELRDKGVSLVPRLTLEDERLRMHGAAVLADGVLAGWLDGDEAEGVNWVRGWVKRSLVQSACTGHPDGHVSAWTRLINHRIEADEMEGRPRFQIDITLGARLVDLARCPLAPEDEEDIKTIEKAIVQTVADTVEGAVLRAQKELQIDFLGLGERWRRKFPHKYDKQGWKSLFQDSVIEVRVAMAPTGVDFPGQLRHNVPYR